MYCTVLTYLSGSLVFCEFTCVSIYTQSTFLGSSIRDGKSLCNGQFVWFLLIHVSRWARGKVSLKVSLKTLKLNFVSFVSCDLFNQVSESLMSFGFLDTILPTSPGLTKPELALRQGIEAAVFITLGASTMMIGDPTWSFDFGGGGS